MGEHVAMLLLLQHDIDKELGFKELDLLDTFTAITLF